MQQALERLRLPVCLPCSEALSKSQNSRESIPTIDPLPIGRRSNPGQPSQTREHLERPHRQTNSALYSRRRQQHRLTTTDTMQPTLPQQVRDRSHPSIPSIGLRALTQSSRTCTASSPPATTACSSGAPASRTSRSRASTALGMRPRKEVPSIGPNIESRREKLTRNVLQLPDPQAQARPVHPRRSPQDVSQTNSF